MKKIFSIITITIITISSFLYYEVYISYNKLTESNYTIKNKKIDNDINIVIISDLHDNNLGENNQKLIDKINSISPNIILVVGDMLNEYSKDSNIVTNLMKQISENYKVFYSLGNTEEDYIKLGTSELLKELESSGITVLDNEYEDLKVGENTIRIGGMYDYAFGQINEDTYNFLCDFQNTDSYKIMMSHRPDSFIFGDASEVWDIDLVVSGHTHGGQIVIPYLGGLYVGDQGWFPEYDKGLFELNRIKVLITSGLGSGEQKIPRFNNIPEVINLKISNSKK